MLASQLAPKYRYENCAVVAIGDGGVVVGAQIAMQLHCILTMLMIEEIKLPMEDQTVAGMLSDGTFSYSHELSGGQMEEINSEFRGYMEQEKLTKFHNMNTLVGGSGTIDKSFLRGHNIIIVSDGFSNSFSLDMALDFLKLVAVERIIVATPLASVPAIDRMHIGADEICCLSVIENYIDTDHYYDQRDVPDHKKVIETIEKIILNWK
ncbi:MAG: phosphoribosyltransferase [Candidatus Saccharibacteria bacterium]|nr:phosphoribosyltransferase [Candidatus Saccharibacteria bacterium]